LPVRWKSGRNGAQMTPLVWLIFVTAAILEVSGDAMIWKGLRGWGWAAIAAGGLMLASYGLIVNLVKWKFAKLLRVYVAGFAVVSSPLAVWSSTKPCRNPRGWAWG